MADTAIIVAGCVVNKGKKKSSEEKKNCHIVLIADSDDYFKDTKEANVEIKDLDNTTFEFKIVKVNALKKKRRLRITFFASKFEEKNNTPIESGQLSITVKDPPTATTAVPVVYDDVTEE